MNKLIFTLLTFLLILPNNIMANTESKQFSMEELSIQIMPEYAPHPKDGNKEQPPLLIGYNGILMNKNGAPQKGKIEIPLPMKAENFRIGYVADYNRDQTKTNEIEYEIDKNKQMISWITTDEIQPGELYKFVIEFYTDDLNVAKNTKKLSYQFKSFAEIGLVNILFLEPLKSESFRLNPPSDTHQENGYGMNMFMYQIKDMKPNDVKEINLEYKRTETKTTMDIMNEMSNKNPQESKVKNKEFVPKSTIMGVIGGLITVFTIILLFLLKRRAKKNNAQPEQKPVRNDLEGLNSKKKHLRGKLLAGSISEQEYRESLRMLGE